MSREKNLSKEAVLSLTKPVVFHDMINNWPVLQWEIKDWSAVFGDKQLPFRCGVKSCCPDPMWEIQCSKETMTIKEFSQLKSQVNKTAEDEPKWFYFDYQQINDWTCTNIENVISMNWDAFGFPEKGVGDSTIWIGSKGAHTPCHFDTYGCNLVAQILGTKRWILFPPDDTKDMKPTRVPYEESSVYSLWNFNCPLPIEFYANSNRRAYVVDLSPGDVLFVPRHWWHYVESLDFSISINTWLPIDEEDDVSRLDEAFVQLFISQMSKNLSAEERSKVLNPNENDVASFELQHSANIISVCADNVRKFREKCSEIKEPPAKQPKLDVLDKSKLSSILEMSNVQPLPCNTLDQLKSLMDQTCNCPTEERHAKAMTQKNISEFSCQVQNVFNAFCHPDIVAQVRENILKINVQ